jgi:two-component system chemotaxis response regulator CheB
MKKAIRVMLCDDSATMRRLIKRAIETDPEVTVVAEAKHGQDALDQLPNAKPDIVILDVEMPTMDGIDTTKAIRKIDPHLPIVMFSSLTNRGAEATFDAMKAGANEFATKPVAIGHVEQALRQVRDDLIPKIVTLTSDNQRRKTRVKPKETLRTPDVPRTFAAPVANTSANTSTIPSSFDIVAIGVSTGGPDALERVLANLPQGFTTPIVITQHMPPVFTTMLAQRLSEKTGRRILEAEDKKTLNPNDILIAPGNYHLVVSRSGTAVQTELNQDPPENSCRPAVDPLFRSVADTYGRRALGVVLTGMGQDGTDGAKAMKATGATIFAQDEKSSVVWGMPRKVVEAGYADRVLAISEIGHVIGRSGGRATQAEFRSPIKAGSK